MHGRLCTHCSNCVLCQTALNVFLHVFITQIVVGVQRIKIRCQSTLSSVTPSSTSLPDTIQQLTPSQFLQGIKRNTVEHADKFTSLAHLFSCTSKQLKDMSIPTYFLLYSICKLTTVNIESIF